MNTYRILAAFMLIAFALGACGTTSTPTPTQAVMIPNTGDATIGTVNTVQTRVQAGPIENLSNVSVSQILYSNDAVHVTDGGIALLNFFDQIALKLFNDTTVGGVSAEILGPTNRRIHMKLERGGLSGQVVKDSGGADFEIANGVHIYILGTTFYITYDPAADVVSAGNFGGVVGYQVPGQSPQLLPTGSLVDILPGGAVQVSNMPFDIKAFDLAAQGSASPIQGLRNLRGLSATLTPTPISAETVTSTLTAGAVIYVPPVSTVEHVPPPTPCYHPAGWVAYIVQSGDTLSGISLRFGVTTTTLRNANCMGYSSLIYTGQTLYVPYVPTITPTILNIILTPDTPLPPSVTPTPIDIPTSFQRSFASVAYCTVEFSVMASDPDGIDAVKVTYSVNGLNPLTADMSQDKDVYAFRTSLKQNTSPSDKITYYFQAIDLLGRITKSSDTAIKAGDCQVGMGMR